MEEDDDKCDSFAFECMMCDFREQIDELEEIVDKLLEEFEKGEEDIKGCNELQIKEYNKKNGKIWNTYIDRTQEIQEIKREMDEFERLYYDKI